MRLRPALALVATAVGAGGCALLTGVDGGSPPAEVALSSGLRLRVEAVPTMVRSGDSLALRVVVRNPTGAPVTVTSGCSALALLGVARADGRESRLPAGLGCRASVRTFTLGPGEAVAAEDRLVVRDYAGGPAAPGTYVVQGYSQLPGDTRTGPRNEALPNAEARFTVR